MITPSLPSNFANAISPFSPMGRSAVGEENVDSKITSFKPVEELQETGRADVRHSPAERAVLAEDQVVSYERDSAEQEGSSGRDEGGNTQSDDQEDSEQAEIAELASQDREVRAHEAAHAAVGGSLAGAPSFEYVRGPDGVSYAVAGEVPIKTGNVPGDPEATLRNAQIVQRAALAPAEPSPQDRRVAAEAAQLELQALQEIAARAAEERALKADEVEQQREENELQAQSDEDISIREDDAEESFFTAEDEKEVQSLSDYQQRSIDVGRRMIDIGAAYNPASVGSLIILRA